MSVCTRINSLKAGDLHGVRTYYGLMAGRASCCANQYTCPSFTMLRCVSSPISNASERMCFESRPFGNVHVRHLVASQHSTPGTPHDACTSQTSGVGGRHMTHSIGVTIPRSVMRTLHYIKKTLCGCVLVESRSSTCGLYMWQNNPFCSMLHNQTLWDLDH